MKNENLVPKVRFKGFSDPWEQRKLGDISKITAGGDIDKDKLSTRGRYPVIANALTNNGVVGYYDSYKVKGPAVTVTGRGDVGHAKTRIESFTPIVRLLVVSAPNFDINFLENAINNIRIFNESTGVPQLTAPQLGSYEFEYPCSSEQVCIGNVLHKIDNLIAANEDKLEQLKTLKKLMMQKIFSQEWRFKGFTDPWEQRKLGELSNGFTYGLNASAKAYDGKHQYLRITDIDDETRTFKQTHLTSPDIDFIRDNSYVLKLGDIVFTRTGASTGKTFIYRTADSIVYYAGFLIKMSVREDIDSEFVFQNTLTTSFNRFVKVMSQRSGQPGINSKEYARFKLYIPKLKEQVLVGNMLLLIDNLIAANEDKLNQLKELKKYLMQNMFV
ncbi:restriction endonuclease subunit S [Lactiplantibacillus plantarum]|uniref:restriction endonuclease subunit S n=1 Tax=Lactiplantibacillus plantarum TaxID=1590 RepID=UPI000D58B878|nr:restriction endonuclease subunit S [Lactiplantibacillus plantarum]AWI39749.1 restriction endonuclease subunit S [Lactiplantibacillus plantarum]MCG0655353.1 restriction endonuclease subunit S [Lactiplantibacillus plantarum]MDN7039903.1 restriction endonuclease subunit S [Lactiplantibacillus plantarum]QHS18744.1 restriction endonuclease subunit S [Lactiplantibacillus plantarum]UTV84537.1 restriction endonuclease subunit S [Lactiplantibacillus plantarum]